MGNITWDDLLTAVGIALEEAGMNYEDFCELVGYHPQSSPQASEPQH